MNGLRAQAGPVSFPSEGEMLRQALWFVHLRWLAGAAILVGAATARWGLDLPLSASAFGVGLTVLLYNAVLFLYLRGGRPPLAGLVHFQIALDQLALTCLIHLSGGIGSPLLPFFVFHAVLSATFLRRRDALLQAGLAVALVTGAALLERAGWLASAPGLPWRAGDRPLTYTLGAFAATQFVAVLLTASAASALRTREERLNRLQQDLGEAYRRLEEMDSARAQFVLTLTHELRSPVAAVESLLKALPYAGELPQKARELAERAGQRASALVHLVNDLLEVARERHDYGAKKFQPIDLGRVLQSVRAAHQGRAEAKGVALVFEGLEADIRLPGDPEDLERLFGNLADNAIKYTPEGGRVTVKTRRKAEGGRREETHASRLTPHASSEWAEVAVSDTGIGIPAESLRRLFEEFYRAPNAKRALAHGTGLGLTICKRIAEEHGGDIRVESLENIGATFTVRLPLSSEMR